MRKQKKAISSESFYIDLPVVDNFADISNPDIYTEVPDDWHVAVSDVKDSTGTIQRGGYREVNLLGASSIIALLNLKKSFSLPFIFGGDGATVCIPESLLAQAKQSLLATKEMAKNAYGLELRVGIVPLRYIRQQGFDVTVARCRISETFFQAVFSGGGLQFAEECVKDILTGNQFRLDEGDAEPVADFSGLECRWKSIPSVHGDVVSLIVQAIGTSAKKNNETYRDVLEQIGKIYGNDAMCRPVREEDLSMSFSESQLSGESKIRSYAKGKMYRIGYWFKIRYGVLLGMLLMGMKQKTKSTDWGEYKNRLASNTDYKKFDDKLRQVISGTPQQREYLQAYLEKKFRSRELVYGMHVAASALVTCMIFNYHKDHIHLVDSDNGGYALAAAQLKVRLKSLGTKR